MSCRIVIGAATPVHAIVLNPTFLALFIYGGTGDGFTVSSPDKLAIYISKAVLYSVIRADQPLTWIDVSGRPKSIFSIPILHLSKGPYPPRRTTAIALSIRLMYLGSLLR